MAKSVPVAKAVVARKRAAPPVAVALVPSREAAEARAVAELGKAAAAVKGKAPKAPKPTRSRRK